MPRVDEENTITRYAIFFPHGTSVFPTPGQYWHNTLKRTEHALDATLFQSEETARAKAELEWGPHETQIVEVQAHVTVLEKKNRA